MRSEANTLSLYSDLIALDFRPIQGLSLYSDLISLDYRAPEPIAGLSLYSDLIALDYTGPVSAAGLELFSNSLTLDYKPPDFHDLQIAVQIPSEGTGQFRVGWSIISEQSWGSDGRLESRLFLSKSYDEVLNSSGSGLIIPTYGHSITHPPDRTWLTDIIPHGRWFGQLRLEDNFSNLFTSDIFEYTFPAPEIIGGGDPDDGGYIPPQPENTYSIRGRIMGSQDLGDVRVRLTGDDSKSTSLASDGRFSFLRLDEGNYNLTPLSSIYDFSPSSLNVSLTQDRANQDFSASKKPPDTTNSFTIAGVEVRGSGITVDGDSRQGSGDFTIGGVLKFDGSLQANLSNQTITLSGTLKLTVSRKEIFSFSVQNRTLDFSTLKLSFDQNGGDARRIKFHGLTFEVSEIGFSLANGGFESFLFRGAMVFSKNLLKISSGSNEVRFDFQSQNRYILYRPGGSPKWEVVGAVSFDSTHGLGVKGVAALNSGSFEFDTVRDKYKISASLSVGSFFGGIDGSIGFRRGKLDSFGLGFSGLNKPLGNTGLFFQSIYGEVENICYFTHSCRDPAILALRNVAISGGPEFEIPFTNKKAYLIKLTMSGEYSFAGVLSGEADVTLLTDDLQMASAAFELKKGFLYLEGTLTLADFLSARGALRYDKKAKDSARRLEAGFDGSLTIQKKWKIIGPIAGGSELNTRIYLNRKYLAAGVKYEVCPWGYCKTLFSGSVSHQHGDAYGPTHWDADWGMDKVREVSANPALYRLISQSIGGSYMGILAASQIARNFFVDDSGEQVVVRLLYTGSLPAQISLSAPDGAQITADNEEYKVLFFPGEDSSEYLIYLLEPLGGNWSLNFDDSSLLDYTIEIYGPNQAPQISIQSPTEPVILQGGVDSLPVSVSVSDTDSLTVSFYLDEDMEGEDGLFVQSFANAGTDLSENLTLPGALAPGDYFLYARAEDGKNFPVVDYSPARITWVSTSTLESVQDVVLSTEPEGLRVSFSALQSTTIEAYEIFYHDGTEEESESIQGEDTTLLLGDLLAGRTYTIEVVAIAQDGSRSLKSEPVALLYAPPGVNQTPIIETPNPASPQVGEIFSLTLKATDPEGGGLIHRLLSYPQGMVINEQSGVITWTPGEEQVGVHLVSVEVLDSEGAGSNLEFEILVYSAFVINRPPAIGQAQITTTMILGQSLSVSLPVTDPEGEVLSVTLNSAPEGMQVQGETLSFTPVEAKHYDVEAVISDGELQSSLLLSIEVIPESPSCTLSLPEGNARLLEPLSFVLSGQGGSPPYNYRFDFSGEGTFASPFTTASTTTHTFETETNPGLLQVQAEVRDIQGLLGRCAGSLLLADAEGNYAPVIFATLSPTVVQPSKPAIVSLSGTYDDQDLIEDLLVSWEYSGNTSEGFSFGDLSRTLSFAESGVYSIEIEVKDSEGKVSQEELSLRVETLSLSSNPPRTADLGQSFVHQFSPVGGNGPYHFELLSGLIPEGLNLSGNLGSISGTPDQSGVFGFSVQISDSTSPALTETFALSLEVRGIEEIPTLYFSRALNAGWNLISIPVGIDSLSMGDLLGQNLGKVRVGWKLKDGLWSVYLPPQAPEYERQGLNAPRFTATEGGEGIFLLASEGFTMFFSGPPLGLDVLESGNGFSLIGVGESVGAAVFMLEHSRATMWSYRDGVWAVSQSELTLEELQTLYGENVQRLEMLEPTEGYFIK